MHAHEHIYKLYAYKIQMRSMVYNTNVDEIRKNKHTDTCIERNFNIMQFYLIKQIIYKHYELTTFCNYGLILKVCSTYKLKFLSTMTLVLKF